VVVRVANLDRQATIGDHVLVAETWWRRLRGLLGRPPLQAGDGLLIRPCRAVHMFGMRYAIDLIFLDDRNRVEATYADLRPGRMTHFHRVAVAALELPAGQLARTGTQVGDRLEVTPAPALS
jgi:uncharacterized membrane protein (UPF0127 family)